MGFVKTTLTAADKNWGREIERCRGIDEADCGGWLVIAPGQWLRLDALEGPSFTSSILNTTCPQSTACS